MLIQIKSNRQPKKKTQKTPIELDRGFYKQNRELKSSLRLHPLAVLQLRLSAVRLVFESKSQCDCRSDHCNYFLILFQFLSVRLSNDDANIINYFYITHLYLIFFIYQLDFSVFEISIWETIIFAIHQ